MAKSSTLIMILVVFPTKSIIICMNIEQLVKSIVAHLTGEYPTISIEEDEFGAVITIVVSGKISSLVGKNGTTIDALRTLLKALGYNGKHRIKLTIHEQEA